MKPDLIKRLLLIVTILLSCVGCDQATKSVAKAYLSETASLSVLGGSIRLQLAKNYGAFLNLGSSLTPAWRERAFIVGVAVVLVGLLAFAFLTRSRDRIMTSAIALVIGGGLGNLMDRLLHGGYVVDFINLGIGSLRTGIFNVADVCIVGGTLLLLFSRRRRNIS